MRKYVVLAIDDNPKYGYYLPLLLFGWRSIGWDVIIFYVGQKNSRNELIMDTFDLLNSKLTPQYKEYYKLVIVGIDSIVGYKDETVAQVSRLYACCLSHPSVFLMTSDADMLPLSDYWKIEQKALYTDRNGNKKHLFDPTPTAWGRDLTDYHFPICYVGMQASDWIDVMQLHKLDPNEMIRRDLKEIPPRQSVWCQDQDIITQRILEYGEQKIKKVKRGTDLRTGYPLGRVDRSNWHLNHTQLIDAHLPHDILTNDESYNKVVNLLTHVWPGVDFTWYYQYHKEFKKLL
jgi:hypothetical protein